MGLSGTKQKQRIPDDPRNTKWANDTSAPGFRLLSSMGWTPTAPALGNVDSQSLISLGGGSTFSKKISVIPTAKDNTLGIGARKAGAGIGGIRAMGLPVGSMGAPVTPLELPSPLDPLSPATSTPASPALTTLLKNPRMAARSKHLRAKRMVSTASAAAMAEILGIAPPSDSPSPSASSRSPSVLPSSISSVPFATKHATSEPLKIAGPSDEGFPEAPKRAFPMFASASAGTGLAATFVPPVVVETTVEQPVEEETEKAKLKREKRERKDAKRSKKEAAAATTSPADVVVEAPAPAPARKFPSFTSSSSSVIAATFEAPPPAVVEVVEEVVVKERKRDKKSRKSDVAMDVDSPAAEGGEEVDEKERKLAKKARKEEKRRIKAAAEEDA
ncbi:hypothetical protein RQP46_006650 [Phenoliferia psychrophenolica]